MNHCNTCKYWDHTLYKDEEGCGVCDKIGHFKDDSVFNDDHKAFAEDTEDEAAWLVTALDFGCNQHKAKEIVKKYLQCTDCKHYENSGFRHLCVREEVYELPPLELKICEHFEGWR